MKDAPIGVNKKDGKYIFSKAGVYFSVTESQLRELKALADEILGEEMTMHRWVVYGRKYGTPILAIPREGDISRFGPNQSRFSVVPTFIRKTDLSMTEKDESQ